MTNQTDMITDEDAPNSAGQPGMKDVRFDELFEDIFGLSGRSISTIRSLIVKPVKYFQAAKHPFWQNTYSPSFRIFLGLMALSTALKFFYARPGGSFFQYGEQALNEIIVDTAPDLRTMGIDPNTIDSGAAVEQIYQTLFLLATPLSILLFLIVAFFFRAFGERLSYVVRVRYIFAALIPLAAISLLNSISMVFLGPAWIDTLSNVDPLLSIALVAVTAYRGAFSIIDSRKVRAFRTFALATILAIVYFSAGFISMGLGIYQVTTQYEVPPVVTQNSADVSPPEIRVSPSKVSPPEKGEPPAKATNED